MNYKNFYLSISLRLLILITLSVLAAYYIWVDTNIPYVVGISLITVLVAINTIRYFNKLNQWIAYFILGIENEDTTLKIPQKSGNNSIDEVYRGLGRLYDKYKEAKVENSTQEEYFKTVIDQSATGLFSINEEGRIININPAAEQLISLSYHQHINSLASINEALPPFILNDKLRNKSTIFENHHGQKLLFKVSRIITPEESITLIAVSDITKELDISEVDGWVKLARTLAHEIMNSITPITTLSQVILGYFKKGNQVISPSEMQEITIKNSIKGLEVIEDRSSGLLKFVENYRKFTKLPEPVIDIVDLSDLLDKVVLASSTFAGAKNVRIDKNYEENISIETDDDLLTQVLINLVKNAIEHLNEIKLDRQPIIKLRVTQNNDNIVLSVCNNGLPIPPEMREQIFIPFFTTKESGSGIGLSLSKQILLKLGGDINLSSDSSEFTCFNVTFKN